MSWFTGLFGGGETANKAMDIADKSLSGIGNWIDNKDYTQQEKAIDLNKAVDSHLKLIAAIADENSTRSITRRWLAFGIVGYVLLWGSVAMIFAIRGETQIVNDMLAVMAGLSIGMAFLAVVGLYFGVQFLRGGKK